MAVEHAAPRTRTGVIDLSYAISPDFPLFPVYDPAEVRDKYTREKDGFFVRTWTFDEHCGTHVDAPAHFGGETTVDRIPPEDLVLQVAVLDVRERVAGDHDALVTPDDLLAWERRNGPLPDAPCAVLALTGWGERVHDDVAYLNMDDGGLAHFPGFGVPLSEFIQEECPQVRAVGLDTASIDFGATMEFPFHGSWLPTGRFGIENLANLDRVPERGATLVVGAPALLGGSGGPSRILALT